jgi:hypothetical protein
MDGVITKAINKYCKFMESEFIGYSYGLYKFRDKNGDEISLTQRDLIGITRDF